MIRSLADKLTAGVFDGHRVTALPPLAQDAARRKVKAIDAAKANDDRRVRTGNRMKKLARERGGQWSIRINDQWRALACEGKPWRQVDAARVPLHLPFSGRATDT